MFYAIVFPHPHHGKVFLSKKYELCSKVVLKFLKSDTFASAAFKETFEEIVKYFASYSWLFNLGNFRDLISVLYNEFYRA